MENTSVNRLFPVTGSADREIASNILTEIFGPAPTGSYNLQLVKQ